MRTLIGTILPIGLLLAPQIATAQGPGEALTKQADTDDLVSRMMAFDKDKDGTLSRPEVTDARLLRLFDRADADKDEIVTKAELAALASREHADDRGFGGPPRGGPGGPGGPMMMPRPGEILPPMLRQGLKLTAEQSKQLDALQKEVDGKMDAILTPEQTKQLKEMRQRRPGGFGPSGGRGPGGRGPGGPGGPPPGGPDGPPPGGPGA